LTARYDAIVVGSGPNGLAAAITLARAHHSVLVIEANNAIGGGARSAELTLPGFTHDICSSILPLTITSPFFASVPLADYGVEFVYPPTPFAHPLDGGSAVALERSVQTTCEALGIDAASYRRLMQPLVNDAAKIIPDLLRPLPNPHHLIAFARFGIPAIIPSRSLAEFLFRRDPARALFAGAAAHSMLPLEQSPTSAYALTLMIVAHAKGWPLVRGGTQKLTDALAAYLRSLGGEIVLGRRVESIDELPAAQAVVFDVTAKQLLRIAGKRFPDSYCRALDRFRYGPGIFKMDFALHGPIPWQARECLRAGVVHIGGTLLEIAESERAVWAGNPAERPFVLLAQQTLFDSTRAPTGKHTAWAYCHVPNGSNFDMSERIEAQIERFAPGFRDRILARCARTPAMVEQDNANYVGGDINGGAATLGQLFTRPVARVVPYSTPVKGIYICSSSTPPGGGVHGMCGYNAATALLRDWGKTK
jgi:phytoene dehydrogenase-like protein